ncbi:hypothetical protein A2U01_0045504, partial [Trifolium medium]|nr:hypothetical protein [Trifolium medium]
KKVELANYVSDHQEQHQQLPWKCRCCDAQ